MATRAGVDRPDRLASRKRAATGASKRLESPKALPQIA
jgi:hypothetical protein